MKTELRRLYIWSTSTATWWISNGYWLSFSKLFLSFYFFFMIFGPLALCLGSKKAFMAYFIILDTWCTLEGGLGYISRGCLAGLLRTIDLGTTSFTFWQRWQWIVVAFLARYFNIWFCTFRRWGYLSWLAF